MTQQHQDKCLKCGSWQPFQTNTCLYCGEKLTQPIQQYQSPPIDEEKELRIKLMKARLDQLTKYRRRY